MIKNPPSELPGIAAIDIGTNSIHLVIARTDHYGHMVHTDSDKEVVRLGEAIDEQGNFTESAIEKAADIITHMKEIAAVHKPVFRVVATHATRIAKNYNEFLERIYEKSGLQVSLIDGDEEARLVSLGMQWGLPLEDKTFLGLDIGGGSSEIIVCKKDQIRYVTSLELGAVILNRDFLRDEKITPDRIEAMSEEIDLKLSPLQSVAGKLEFECAVVCSGAAKTLAHMHAFDSGSERLEDPNGYHISGEAIRDLKRQIRRCATPEKIRKRWDLEATRSDIILAGSMILDKMTRLLGVSEWIISSNGVREGLVHDTLQRMYSLPLQGFGDVRWNNILRLGEHFQVDKQHAEQVSSIALSLYDQLGEIFPGKEKSPPAFQVPDRSLLKAAAWLHECGKFLSFSRYHRHSLYLIANSRLMGFSQRERRLIGLIARYHRKGKAGKKSYDSKDLSGKDRKKINYLSALLRIAAAANRSRQKLIRSVKVTREDAGLCFMVETSGSGAGRVELAKMNREKRMLEEHLDLSVKLHNRAEYEAE